MRLTNEPFFLGAIRARAPDPHFTSSNGPLPYHRPINRGLDGPTIRSSLPGALRKEIPWTLVVGVQQFHVVSEEAKKILCETMEQYFAKKTEQANRNAEEK